jgi:hypothetical protein
MSGTTQGKSFHTNTSKISIKDNQVAVGVPRRSESHSRLGGSDGKLPYMRVFI